MLIETIQEMKLERIKSLRRFLKKNNIEHKILQNMEVKIFVISFNGTETKYLIPKAETLYDQNGNLVLTKKEKRYITSGRADLLLFNIADLWFYSKTKAIEKVDNKYSVLVSFNILKFERKLDIKQNFVHLHNHFEFSALDGSLHSGQWIDHCINNGFESIALTDHGTLSGVMDFYLNAKKKNFKPVLGYEAYITDSIKNTTYNHLTLLARNLTGWQNLMRMNTFANRKGFYRKPRITYDILKKYGEGLIILTGCPSSKFSKNLWEDKFDENIKLYKFYCSIAGEENVFLEVQYHTYTSKKDMDEQDTLHRNFFTVYQELKSKFFKPKVVITNDCHYITKDDYELNKALKRISKDGYDSGCTDLYLKTRDEIKEDFNNSVFIKEKLFKKSSIEEWMLRTVEIANRCDVSIETGVHHLPAFDYDKSKYGSNEEMFDDIIAKGYITKIVRKLPKEKHKIYEERLKRESDFIKFAGFVDYFLIVWDVINYAKSQNIMVGFSRGSVAGSLVAYCMSITEIDPIRFDLIFERFLNEARVSKERASATNSLPDIDIDFESAGRDTVKRYLEDKYGSLNVASLATYGKLKLKAAIKDIGRSYGIDYAYVNKVTRLIEDVSDDGDEWRNLAASMKNDVVKEFVDNFPDVINLISRCSKHVRNSSLHAAGVVIAPKTIKIDDRDVKARIDSFVPVKMQSSASNKDEKIMATEWEGDFVEKRGLVKLDILGIDQLDIFKATLKLIEKNHGKKIDLSEINLNDKKVYERFASGDTEAVFQFKSDSQRAYQKVLLPERFEHLMASNALIRPGTLANNTHMDYVDIKNGDKDVEYLKGMKEIMKTTYGLLIYEEQIMQIASHGGGFSLVDADIMRAAVKKANTKPELIPVMMSYKEKFMNGLKTIHKYSDKEAESLWNMMESFLGYSFNKAHACGYAFTSYCCQWLKVHYPKEFWVINLQHDDKNRINNISRILKDYKDIKIKFPDVNVSRSDFHLKGDSIYWGLMHIKGVGEKGADAIIKARKEKGKFKDLKDFFDKVEKRVINKRVVEALIYSGAFDRLYDIGDEIKNRYELIEIYYSKIRREKAIPEKKDPIAEYKNLIGMTMVNWDAIIEEKGINDFVNMKEFEEVQNDSIVSVAGIVSSMNDYLPKGKTDDDERMGFVTLEQNNFNLSLILWKDFWSLNKKKFKVGSMVMFRGIKRFDDYRKKHVLYSCNESKAYKLKMEK